MENKKIYHSLEQRQILKVFNTSINGLSDKEALIRLKHYGKNEIADHKRFSALTLFISQLKNPLIYILIFALLISLFTKHYADAGIISVVVMLSILVGFFQEYKANSALSRLRTMIHYKARVFRNAKEKVVERENLVPGDIIILNAGDKVPADARIIEAINLETIEAPLTGESMPIEKHTDKMPISTQLAERKNMLYLATVIARGSAKAVVVSTGEKTEIGKIAKLVKETEEGITPLQKQILRFGKMIAILLIILNIIIFTLGIIKGMPFFDMFMVSISMIVAAVPEGLLPAMTVILAIGMQRLANQKGLVRKMLASETLGAVSVICTDKTGTLTEGEMRVVEILTEEKTLLHNGNSFSEIIDHQIDSSHLTAIKIAVLCNNAIIENPDDTLKKWTVLGNPTEKALLLAGISAGIHKDDLEKTEKRIHEIPFESEYKYMLTSHSYEKNKAISYLKGAPEKIIEMSSYMDLDGKKKTLDDEKRKEITKNFEKYTKKGLRVIAVAYKISHLSEIPIQSKDDFLKDFVFVGLIVLKDPLRPEVKKTIELCKSAGIRPIIITGDNKLTAMAIVRDMGLKLKNENVLEGSDLDKMSEADLKKVLNKILIYARVEPRHKLQIVTALQEKHEIVAMTGDGVNDAPALKKADIGVAVGSGTDVAKETADLVLLDDNFKTIVEAVRIGRGTFDNIRKVVLYLLSNSFTELVLIGLSLLFGLPLALLPVQILWIKMIEDSFPSIALAFDPVDENVMERKPRDPKDTILNGNLKKLLILFIVVSDLFLFGIFYYFWNISKDIAYSQTIAFVGLGIASRFYIFSIRGLTKPIYTYNPFKNKFINYSTIFGFLMILVAVYIPFFNRILHTQPLGLKEWGVLVVYAFATIFIYEMGKIFFIKNSNKNN